MVKEKKEIRRYRRFCGYDYSRGAALFITIVTNPRRRLFGKIVGAKLQKTPLGLAVEQRFAEMAQLPGIRRCRTISKWAAYGLRRFAIAARRSSRAATAKSNSRGRRALR